METENEYETQIVPEHFPYIVIIQASKANYKNEDNLTIMFSNILEWYELEVLAETLLQEFGLFQATFDLKTKKSWFKTLTSQTLTLLIEQRHWALNDKQRKTELRSKATKRIIYVWKSKLCSELWLIQNRNGRCLTNVFESRVTLCARAHTRSSVHKMTTPGLCRYGRFKGSKRLTWFVHEMGAHTIGDITELCWLLIIKITLFSWVN